MPTVDGSSLYSKISSSQKNGMTEPSMKKGPLLEYNSSMQKCSLRTKLAGSSSVKGSFADLGSNEVLNTGTVTQKDYGISSFKIYSIQ